MSKIGILNLQGCKAIDFGKVLSNKFILTEKENKIFKYNLKNEINKIILKLITFEKNPYIKKLLKKDYDKNIYKLIKKTKEYKDIYKKIKNKEDAYYIFQILYNDMFQREYLKIDIQKPIFRIDLDDILFMFNNKNNLIKIIKYFYNKLK